MTSSQAQLTNRVLGGVYGAGGTKFQADSAQLEPGYELSLAISQQCVVRKCIYFERAG